MLYCAAYIDFLTSQRFELGLKTPNWYGDFMWFLLRYWCGMPTAQVAARTGRSTGGPGVGSVSAGAAKGSPPGKMMSLWVDTQFPKLSIIPPSDCGEMLEQVCGKVMKSLGIKCDKQTAWFVCGCFDRGRFRFSILVWGSFSNRNYKKRRGNSRPSFHFQISFSCFKRACMVAFC